VAVGKGALTSDAKGNRSTAIGHSALNSQNFTSSSNSQNTAVGFQAGLSTTTGISNTFIGAVSGGLNTTGTGNTALGVEAGYANQSSNNNTMIGRSAGIAATGEDNTFVGRSAGSVMTSGSDNTLIGRFNGNGSGVDIRTESNHIVLSDGSGVPKFRVTGGSNDNQVFAPGVYTWTTSNPANVIVTSSTGHLARSTSALKYKQDIRDLEEMDIDNFRPVRYKSQCQVDDQTVDHFGIIADEVHNQGITELVTYGDDNEVEGFKYERLTAVLVKVLQQQKATITALEARIATLEG
jgi:hypothetical protein